MPMKRLYLPAPSWAAIVVASLPAQAATIEITIEKLTFNPPAVDAKIGDTIDWVNKDIMVHTATADGRFDVMIPAHKSASFTVTKSGAFDYYCRFHPNMRARLNVAAN